MSEGSKPQARKSTREDVERGKTEVELGVVANQVVMKFPQPMEFVTFDPENARTIAEHIARAAYEAKHGSQPPPTQSELMREARNKFTEELRIRMINRVVIMLQSESMIQATPGRRAMNVVDAVMKELA